MLTLNCLKKRSERYRQAIDQAVKRVVDSGWYVLGPELERFEQAFCDYTGAEHCVGVANGTDALELAFRAVGVLPGQRVATASNAGMYASTALLAIGAEPFFMDVSEKSHCITTAEVRRAISSGVKAVAVTHLYGLACPDTHEIQNICREASIPLIEDCAQAHGARIGENSVGTFGDVSCFSFYPTKNLGALGDGGALVTNNDGLAECLRELRQYGWQKKYHARRAGGRNSRLDEIQSAVLLSLLPYLDESNDRRREIAQRYDSEIFHPAVSVPGHEGDGYVAHLYVIRTDRRDSLREHLAAQGIASDIHYPIPDHRQAVFKHEYDGVNLATAEKLAREVVTLPLYPEMSDAQVISVINAVNEWQV